MEPLAYVEIMGRHGDVQARYPVYRWPMCVGRGYESDVILDDPFVAPRHVRIEPATEGRFKVFDLQSVNGIFLSNAVARVAEAELGPEDLLRLGRAQIRVRPPSYAVQSEMRLRATSFYRRPGAFVAAAALLLVLTLWSTWVAITDRDEWGMLFVPTLMLCAVVGVWISVWSLVSRTVGGRANFAAHGFVACAALVAMDVASTSFGYLSFGFDLHWLKHGGTATLAGLAAYMLYRHLRLNSRAPRRTLTLVAVAVVAAGFGIAAGIERATERTREGTQEYDSTLKAPAFLWVSGTTPEVFLAGGEVLRRKADAVARAGN